MNILKNLKTLLLLLLVLVFLFNLPSVNSNFGRAIAVDLNEHTSIIDLQTPEEGYFQYLPITLKSPPPGAPIVPIVLGIYPKNWPGTPEAINEVRAIDAWAGKGLSIIGTFVALNENPESHITDQLTNIWENGYTPFLNLMTTHSADYVANGHEDNELTKWAQAFNVFSNGGERMAFIAPLPEMNGNWVPYGLDPQSYKAAYWHIQSIFTAQGVPPQSVQWVFAPNGPSTKENKFENYYPGNATVDVVGFSSYNFGCHPDYQYKNWLGEYATFRKYLTRITVMAPSKPIFVAQTATTAWYCDTNVSPTFDIGRKNTWLNDAYAYLATYPGVRAVLYYNKSDPIVDDLPFWLSTYQYVGFRDGISNPRYSYLSPQNLKTNFTH